MKAESPIFFVALALGLGACAKPAPVSANAEEAAKKDSLGAREQDLGRVTLTSQEARRLGIASAEIEQKEARPTLTCNGEISVPANQAILISAVIAGFFQLDSDTQPGAQVRAGQRLFRLAPALLLKSGVSADGNTMDPQRTAAEAETLGLRVNNARMEYARQRELLRNRGGSSKAVETARAELAAVETAAAAAEKSAYWVTSEGGIQYEFASPQAGVIMQSVASPGQYVISGTPLIRLASLDPLWVRVAVYSGDWNRIARAAAAEVRPLGTSTAPTGWMAKPIAGPPTADAPTSTRDLYYEVTNPDLRLRPGERVNVRLPLQGAATRLSVARASVVYDVHGGAWIYELISPTEFVRRRVEVDHTTANVALLTTGPKPGTRVVSTGAAELFGMEFGAGK